MDMYKKASRSQVAFTEALIALSKQKDVDKISVSELTRESGYSRNAFYAQFESFPGFLQAVVDEELSYIMPRIQAYFDRDHESGWAELFLSVYEHIYSRQDLYRLIMSTHEPIDMRKYFDDKLLGYHTTQLPEAADMEMSFFYYMSYSIGWACVHFWVQQNFMWSPMKLSEAFLNLSEVFFNSSKQDSVSGFMLPGT